MEPGIEVAEIDIEPLNRKIQLNCYLSLEVKALGI
jgi:hypothetical protein